MGNEGAEALPTWFIGTHHKLFLQDGPQSLVSLADTSAVESRRSIVHTAAVGDIDGGGDLDLSGITGNQRDLAILTSLNGFDGLQSVSRYYWRIGATNYSGQGPWSEIRFFDFGDFIGADTIFKVGFE